MSFFLSVCVSISFECSISVVFKEVPVPKEFPMAKTIGKEVRFFLSFFVCVSITRIELCIVSAEVPV